MPEERVVERCAPAGTRTSRVGTATARPAGDSAAIAATAGPTGLPAVVPHPPEAGPLLPSKLTVAAVPETTLVPRHRLFGLLDAGVANPVTLLSAPAGWGKSVLLASWCRAGRPLLDGTATTAWMTVESSDDPAGLRSYLFAALDTGAGAAGTAAATLEQLAAVLARRPGPIVLVVDDLHRVDPAATLVDDLYYLSRHAGERLRLVISTRTEHTLALHRWRLTGELTEIRVAELAFTAEEAAELFAAHETPLPTDRVRTLHSRTEGWPAGLRFAALALRGHPDPAGFVSGFGGDSGPVADYLRHEVLAGLPDDVRTALARGAVADRICGELLDTLTGRSDGAELLAEAARTAGFLVPVSGAGGYRCHPLLRDLLRAGLRRLPVEERRDLHRRAAGWHAAHGLPEPALRHALAAGDTDHARRLLREHWAEFVPYAPAADPHPVGGGNDAPAPDGGDDAAGVWDACVDGWESPAGHGQPDPFVAARVGLRLARQQLDGDTAAVRSGAELLLGLAATDPAAGAVARAVRGADRLSAGDLPAAERELAGGLALARQAGLRRARLACAGRLALVHAVRGRLRAARDALRTGYDADLAIGAGDDPAELCYPHLARAVVALHRDAPEEAYAGLAAVDGLTDRVRDPVVGVLVAIAQARLRRDQGDLAGAGAALARGRSELADRAPGWPPADWLVAAEADLRTESGDPAAARDLLRRAGGAEPSPTLAVALARATLAGGDPRGAERLLPRWTEPAEEPGWLSLRLEAGLLEALAVRALGDERGAARRLEEVLGLAEPEGFRRVFTRAEPAVRELLTAHLDSGTAYWSMVTALVAVRDRPAQVCTPAGRGLSSAGASPGSRSAVVAGGGSVSLTLREPLTDRELTVLRYLQSILSNVEIAAELSLSVNTVKTHVRNIYRKLETGRRREAVRRARELHLI